MTLEELTAKVEELSSERESLVAKNKELLGELKKERTKAKEIDMDAYHGALDEVESLKSENAKLSGEMKLKAKDTEKLMAQLGEKDSTLQKLIIDDGLTNALTSAGVVPELMPAVKALLRSQAQLKDNQAVINDKPLADFMTEWATTDGKAYIKAPANSGGGAGGSKQGDGGSNIDISKMTPNEMMRVGRNQTT